MAHRALFIVVLLSTCSNFTFPLSLFPPLSNLISHLGLLRPIRVHLSFTRGPHGRIHSTPTSHSVDLYVLLPNRVYFSLNLPGHRTSAARVAVTVIL